ncbi:hypothetical protein [Paenibacillus apiarius]|uniref:hypothetical protein n=1 Tax=Paenibacillus apiarius TaxID=46240 RepID=UPI003B3A6C73
MRNAIRERLIATIPELRDVFEPHAAEAKSEKPYAVVLQGQDSDESPWAGFRRIVEVWPYVSRSTFEYVDVLTGKITAVLDKQLLTTEAGEVFSCIYLGSAQDVVDEDWDAITRGMQFAVMALQPIDSASPITSDPWLTALGEWTQSVMGQDWTVYTGLWPLGYTRPAVMWRVTSVDVQALGKAMYEVKKRFTAHIIGADTNQEHGGVLKLVEGLGNAIKVPLDESDRRYMTVSDLRANISADPIAEGQITVTLRRRTARPTEDAPVIQSVNFKSDMR